MSRWPFLLARSSDYASTGCTTFTYERSRVIAITEPDGRVTQLEYDDERHLARRVDPDGEVHEWVAAAYRQPSEPPPVPKKRTPGKKATAKSAKHAETKAQQTQKGSKPTKKRGRPRN